MWELIVQNPGFAVFGLLTLVQIAPIKVNPWTWIASIIKKGIGITDLLLEIADVKKDIVQDRAESWRWNILNFGNSCRNGVRHTKEEWDHAIEIIKKYEKLCSDNNISNGVIDEESRYLRDLYRDRLEHNDFL